jgi:hypothetical protein
MIADQILETRISEGHEIDLPPDVKCVAGKPITMQSADWGLTRMSRDSLAYQRRGAIAIVTIDDAPYNRMSFACMDVLESLVSACITSTAG